MNRFIPVVKNEIIKVVYKKSTAVIAILMLVLFVFLGIVFKIQYNDAKTQEKGQVVDHSENFLSNVKIFETRLKGLKSSDYVYEYEYELEKFFLECSVKANKFAYEQGENFSYNDWRYEGYLTLSTIANEEFYKSNYLSENKHDESLAKLLKFKEEGFKFLENNDYKSCMNMYIEYLKAKAPLSKADLVRVEIYTFLKDNDIRVESINDDWKSALTAELRNYRIVLATNRQNDYYMQPLSMKERERIESQVALYEYSLKNNINDYSAKSQHFVNYVNVCQMISFMFLGLLMIITAGGGISSEIHTGTIKSLVITPFKRWKILMSKIIAYFVILLTSAVLMYVLISLSATILFGWMDTPYIKLSGNKVLEYNQYIYMFLRMILGLIEPVFYMMFALMLSVITKNTAVSVGLSIFTYLSSSVILSILFVIGASFSSTVWLKFVPFSNFDLVNRVFPSGSDITSGLSGLLGNNGLEISVMFSVAYLALIIFLFGVVMFDSFVRRDIKS